MVKMKIDKIYIVTVKKVLTKNVILDGAHYERKYNRIVKNAVTYLQNNKYIDIQTGERYSVGESEEKLFISPKNEPIPFSELVKDKTDITRKEIIEIIDGGKNEKSI